MSEFLVWRPEGSLGPGFNFASKALKTIGEVEVKDTINLIQGFTVEATDKGIAQIRKQLPGWNIDLKAPRRAA